MIDIWFYIVIVAAATLCGLVILAASYLPLWLQAYFTGTRISLLDLVRMSLRKSSPRVIVQCKVMAVQSGLAALSTSAIEAQYLAGGDVHRVTLALIAADRAGIRLDWTTAAAIDLAGRDVMEAVRVSVDPKVIDCPDPKDGGADTLVWRREGRNPDKSSCAGDGPYECVATRRGRDRSHGGRPRRPGNHLSDWFLQ